MRITRRMRWAARILGGRSMPFRLPVGKVFHRYLSELSDWDTPPFFKSFLHISVTPQALKIRCFAATGCLPQEIEPRSKTRSSSRSPDRNVGATWQSLTHVCGSRGRSRRWRGPASRGPGRRDRHRPGGGRAGAGGERAPRWIWADTREIYPALLDAGVRLARCHDLALTESLLLGYEGRYGEPRSAQAAHARLHGLPAPQDHQGPQARQATLFEEEAPRPTSSWSPRSTPTSSGGSRPSPTPGGSGCWSPPSRPGR
ncbi:hypothetical protein ACFQX6_61985 [Streptosporangium lutulentum]